jgi:hypothetical protein
VLEPVLDGRLLQELFMTSCDFTYLETLSAADRALLSDGLSALLRERSVAYELAVKVALSRGHAQPNVDDFGLSDILRLSRMINVVIG